MSSNKPILFKVKDSYKGEILLNVSKIQHISKVCNQLYSVVIGPNEDDFISIDEMSYFKLIDFLEYVETDEEEYEIHY